ETALKQQPQLRDGVVVVREDQPGDKRLVAYVVAGSTERVSTDALREGLKRKLPDYMVPSAFVFLEALPLSPNGKVDRKALPAPERSRAEMDKAYVAPPTPIETQPAELWQTVLGLERIGVEDDFFELGGDSIRAAILINQLQARLGQYV